MKKYNDLWEKFLNERFCEKDENGNRPCDNGFLCQRCDFNDEEWRKYLEQNGGLKND